MARKHTHKSTTTRGSTTTPGTSTTTTATKYQRKPKGAPTGYKAPVASKTTTTSGTPTYRQSYVTNIQSESSRPTIPSAVGTAIDIATPNQSPAPQGKGELVFFAGTGLIVLSGFTSKHIQAMLDLFFNAKKMKYTRQQARVGMVVVGGEFLFLMILTAFSEQSDAFSNVSLALIGGLFLLWGMQNVSTSQNWVDFISGKAKNI